MEWSDLAKLNHHRNLCLFIQLFWRLSANGEECVSTTNWATGFLQANGTMAGSQFGGRQFCANIFVRSHNAWESRSDSDGMLSATVLQVAAECRDRGPRGGRVGAAIRRGGYGGR